MKKRILAFLQSIIDKHEIKYLNNRMHCFGTYCYGSHPLGATTIPNAYYSMYRAFDITFRKVYGGFRSCIPIQSVKFTFIPANEVQNDCWEIEIYSPRVGLLIGRGGVNCDRFTTTFKELFGIDVTLSLYEQKEWFSDFY